MPILTKNGWCLVFFSTFLRLAVYPHLRLAGYDLLKLCLEGPEEQLEQHLGGNRFMGIYLEEHPRTDVSYWVVVCRKFGEMIQFD